MGQVTNTFSSYDVVGDREDLTDQIFNISPTETPFVSNIARTSAENTYHEWQTDSLASVDTTNHQIEGDDIGTYDSTAATTRVGNYTSISRKTLVLSGTNEVVNKAGRNSELAYQMAKRGQELKRDIEAIVLDNNAAVAGNDSTARELGGLPAWLSTNTSKANDGADPSWSTAPTDARSDGATRSFDETILKDVVKKTWDSGGDPEILMVGSYIKQEVSGFDGIAGQRFQISTPEQGAIIGAADIYVSDFGELRVVPNRFQRGRDAFVLDTSMASLAILRPVEMHQMAKTGDAEKRMLITEYTLKVHNEAAHGIAADLATA